jgi:hypothetical protein
MDSSDSYKTLVRTILEEHRALGQQDSTQPINIHFIFDDERAEYLMVAVGHNTVWNKEVYAILFHGWVQEGKVWIARDNVSPSVVGELIERGIPEKDILPADEQPFVRITQSDLAIATN